MTPNLPRQTIRRCPLCESATCRRLFSARDINARVTDEEFGIVQCTCGMAYLNPMPYDLERYYPPSYDAHRDLSLAPRKPRRGSHRFDRIKSMKPGRVLDVGCGSGYDLIALRERGWEVAGIEVNPQAVRHAQAMGLDVHEGTLEVKLPPTQFDLITLFHVLEHVPDMLSVVREVERLLKPGGMMLAQVPNIESANARLFRKYWYELDVPRHVNFFSAHTLKETIRKGGLNVTSLRSIESSADFRRSLKNRFGGGFGVGTIKPFLRVTYAVLNFWRLGDMLEVMARKRQPD